MSADITKDEERRVMLLHWFWRVMAMSCVIWYVVMTFYVGVRGAIDIRTMLRNLSAQKEDAAERG